MIQRYPAHASALYHTDETAWLEQTAELIRQRRLADVDLNLLAEYLTDMVRWDRREVVSRLTVLLAHLLMWHGQPDRRSGGWKATIIEQRQELVDLASKGTLRNHAENILADAYSRAVERAVAETGLPSEAFPASCPYTPEQIFTVDLTAE